MKITLETMSSVIDSFGDTPAPDTTIDELDQAETAVQLQEEQQVEQEQEHLAEETEDTAEPDALEIGDDDDTEELKMMSPRQLLYYRFMPYLEYGTPAGAEKQAAAGGCPGCSDAADSVIIDAEITPSVGSGKEDEGTETPVSAADEETDLTEELRLYLKGMEQFSLAIDAQAGQEGLVDAFRKVGRAVGYAITKTIKYSRKAWKSIRNNRILTIKRLAIATKFWKFKLKNNLDKVDETRLANYEVTAFPFSDWIEIAKATFLAYDLAIRTDSLVFNSATESVTNEMRQLSNRLKSIGVTFDISRNQIEMDESLDKVRHASVPELGYTKSQIPNLLRYFAEISKRCPPPKTDKFPGIVAKCTKQVTNEAALLAQAVDKGDLTKDSDEYKAKMEAIMRHTVRLDFVLSIQRYTAYMFNRLSRDAQNVFSRYEDAIDSKRFVD